jgi:hypothetical protein
MSSRAYPANGEDSYGNEFLVRRAARTLRKCIGTDCTALVRAPKVRCSPCQADRFDQQNRESRRRVAERRKLGFPVVTK